MATPFDGLPASAFWRSGVAIPGGPAAGGLYAPKFPITRETRIAGAGSCFAQHVMRAFRARGFAVLDAEPPPPFLPRAEAERLGFGLYSARYGNIYTPRQMLRLAEEATGAFRPEGWIWERQGRFLDALRPGTCPDGLADPAEVAALRADHLGKVRQVLERAELLVLTLGLTEAWEHAPSGTVFPMAPGVMAGDFAAGGITFRRFSHAEVLADLEAFTALARRLNPGLRLLLTVSPVPLAATASGQHVLVATIEAKSVLRAAAGQLAGADPGIDYFPSYELIATPFAGRDFFAPDRRSVTPEGVAAAMDLFFAAHDPGGMAGTAPPAQPEPGADPAEDIYCEEVLAEAFAPGRPR